LVFAYFFRRRQVGEGYVNFVLSHHDLLNQAFGDLALVLEEEDLKSITGRSTISLTNCKRNARPIWKSSPKPSRTIGELETKVLQFSAPDKESKSWSSNG
jgi:hypothetical protein